MLYRISVGVIVLAAALLATAPGARAHDESKYPDWSGQWRRVEGGPPRYDHGKPHWRGQEAPLTEEYRLIHEASLAGQASGGQGLYRTRARCIPMGMPWQMYALFPVEFAFTANTTVLSEIMTSQPRRIYTNGRTWPEDQEPLFTGYSIGKWTDEDSDGKYDVLEIETRNMKVPRIYDQTAFRSTRTARASSRSGFTSIRTK